MSCQPFGTDNECDLDNVMEQLYGEGFDYLTEPTKENCAVYKSLMIQFLTKCFKNVSPIIQESFNQTVEEIEAIDCSKIGEGTPEL